MSTSPTQRLWKLILKEKQEIGPIYFYAILNGLLQLAVPIGVQAIIGFVMGASMVTSIYVLVVIIVMAVLLVGLMQIKQMQVIEKIQQKIFTRYAFAFAETIPRLDLIHEDSHYLPERVNRFFDTMSLQKGLSKLLLEIPTASIQIIFGLLLLALYHPIFIIFGFLLLFTLWLILKITGKNGLRTSLKESTYKYAVVAWMEEIAVNIKSFKFSQGTNLNLQKTDTNLVGYLSSRTAHFNVLLFQYWSLVLFKVFITIGMLGVGTYLLIEQQLNIGEFIAAEIVILTVIAAVEKLIMNLDSVYDVITGLEKISLVLESPLEQDGKINLKAKNKGLEIQCMQLSFQYPGSTTILNHIDTHIPSNSLVCISGESGAGKSTLLKLFGTYYKHFEGALLFNQMPMNQYTLESLRKHTGIYLHQEEIFKGSILENITFNRDGISSESVIDMIHQLGLQDDFNLLPDGLETQVYTTGNNLSSTLVKTILLLRAFANNPSLLLMEEPWQGLNEPYKKRLIHYLLSLKQHTTICIVSNDASFANQCDYILELKNGQLKTITNT